MYSLAEGACAILLNGCVTKSAIAGPPATLAGRRCQEVDPLTRRSGPIGPTGLNYCTQEMPRRRPASKNGRLAFMHAIAHIELNAIDLAWDIITRFTGRFAKEFYDDWVEVGADEARHFTMLQKYLERHGTTYGELPAHDGLWEAAEATSDDILARLAVVPLVLEARGLDTTPGAIQKLKTVGDEIAASILETISQEEIPPVAAGVKWFDYICERRGLVPAKTFQNLVQKRFKGFLKPPFAIEARTAAGFPRTYYEPISAH